MYKKFCKRVGRRTDCVKRSNNMLEVLLGSFTEGSSNSGQSLTTAALEILLEEFLNSGNYGRITGGESDSLDWLDVIL